MRLEVCLAMTFCLSLDLLKAGESEEKKITARPLSLKVPMLTALLLSIRRKC